MAADDARRPVSRAPSPVVVQPAGRALGQSPRALSSAPVAASPAVPGVGAWLALQRSAGNRAVASMVAERRGRALSARRVDRSPTIWKRHPVVRPLLEDDDSPFAGIFGEFWPDIRECMRLYASLRDGDHDGREQTLDILAFLIGKWRVRPSQGALEPLNGERVAKLEELVRREQAELRAAREQRRGGGAATSSSSSVGPRSQERGMPTAGPPGETAIGKLVALEGALMDLMDAEADEKALLERLSSDLTKDLLPLEGKLLQALKDWQESSAEPSRAAEAAKRVEELRNELSAQMRALRRRFETGYAEPIERFKVTQVKLKGQVLEKKTEWVGLMEQLCGTHPHGEPRRFEALALRRHDAGPGVYGREPTASDVAVATRRLEVIHGHGVWFRTGLLARGSGAERMPGLTSLREIVERANAFRQHRGAGALELANVELALLTTHGIPAKGETVEAGAGPQLMPLSNRLFADVTRVMAQWHPGKGKHKTLDSFMMAQCKIPDPDNIIRKEIRAKPGVPEKGKYEQPMVWRPPKERSDGSLEYVGGEVFFNAYKRIVEETHGGQPGQFAEVLSGTEHPDVLFPDMGLSYLTGSTLNENLFANAAATEGLGAYRPPGYYLSLWQDVSGGAYEADPALRDDTREVGRILQITRLSDAITQRLAEIDTVLRPVRVVWAACRSEQLPRGFNDQMFLEWIREAAEQRRKARERK